MSKHESSFFYSHPSYSHKNRKLHSLNMPRYSLKCQIKSSLQKELDKLEQEQEIFKLIGIESQVLDVMYQTCLYDYMNIAKSRYMFRESMYRDRSLYWKMMLGDNSHMNETEFLAHFRMSKTMFEELFYLLKDKKSFQFKSVRENLPVQIHLMIFLFFIGSNGNNCTALKIAQKFGVATGSVVNVIERTVSAILEMKNQVIMWPSADERKQISDCLHMKAGFVNCIGLIDGTHFPLEFKPSLNGEEYYTRKGNYATQGLIVCDHLARIRWMKLGWAGSVHDNRVWSTCNLNLFRNIYFSGTEYLLGDSAFKASSVMVPSFKKP